MPDRDHAAMMLSMAEKDFRAIKAMVDEQSFAEKIFWLSCPADCGKDS